MIKRRQIMSEENKNVEEVVKEINPIDEYLNNYKEQKLAEFCVQKDKEIENRKNERQRLMEQLTEMKHKVEKYDKTFSDVKELYAEIKKLSVDDYLKLYHMISEDVSGYSRTSIATITPSYITTDVRGTLFR
jgi:lysyl-tRNA synthetase class I